MVKQMEVACHTKPQGMSSPIRPPQLEQVVNITQPFQPCDIGSSNRNGHPLLDFVTAAYPL